MSAIDAISGKLPPVVKLLNSYHIEMKVIIQVPLTAMHSYIIRKVEYEYCIIRNVCVDTNRAFIV
jgi:hypothetical protein